MDWLIDYVTLSRVNRKARVAEELIERADSQMPDDVAAALFKLDQGWTEYSKEAKE
jgi:hypothetical protein